MTPPRRCAPMAVRFTPEPLSSLRRNQCPVLPEYASPSIWLTARLLKQVLFGFSQVCPQSPILRVIGFSILQGVTKWRLLRIPDQRDHSFRFIVTAHSG